MSGKRGRIAFKELRRYFINKMALIRGIKWIELLTNKRYNRR